MGHPITSYANRCLPAWKLKSQHLETQHVRINPYTGYLCLSPYLRAPKAYGAPSRQTKKSRRAEPGCWGHPAILINTISY